MAGIGIGTVLSIIGTAASVIGTLQQGQAEEESGLAKQQENILQGQLLSQQAQSTREGTGVEAGQFERQQSALRAKARALRAGAGVVPTAGSPLLADQDVTAEIARNKAIIEQGGEVEATRLEQQAALLGQQGQTAADVGEAARRGSFFKAGATALTSAAKFLG